MSFSDFMGKLGGIAYTASSSSRIGDRITSLFDSDISATQSELDAQAAGDRERARIYAENSSLATGFSGEYTPEVVRHILEPFSIMSHSEIMKFVESIDPATMSSSVQGWRQLATDTTTKATAFHDNIQKEMERGWSGSAASQALASTKSYLAEVHKVDQAASLIGNKMEEAYSGFNQVKYSVPHESDKQSSTVGGAVFSALASSIVPGSGTAVSSLMDSTSAGRADAAQAAARQVMETVYAPVAKQSDTQVPKVPTPAKPQSDKPTGETSKDKPTGTTTDKPTGTTTKPSTDDTTPSTTEPETPTTTDPGDDDTTDDQTTDDTTGDETTAATTTPETPTATTPSGTTPGTTPAGTSTGGLGSGGGSGAGAGAGSGAGAGTPGAAVPGTAGQKQGAGAGAGSGASSGRAGTSGMGGMGAPGARGGGKDDENEHQTPDYLRGVHEELLGPERLHVPPVIGGDA
ncbi:hypothetical protein OG308_06695 [Nocardia salmonicida]|uniref:PPE domain-containing protein n=1 Tax=Nocardia salmonicida TaxID=53431 RepID=A0ABZ1NC57_9NOCA